MPAGRFTLAEWKAIPETYKVRHQMLDGVHYMDGVPDTRHQVVLMNVMREFWSRYERPGDIALTYVGVVLSDVDAVIPDFVFVRGERRAIVKDDFIEGAPDLIVEVVGEDTRHLDEVIKVDRYARCGVDEYWVVDPVAATWRVYRRHDKQFVVVPAPTFPLPIADVFAD